MKNGRLDLVLGPMFSGKSTKLIEFVDRYESINKKVLKITHPIDDRYGSNVISSHNKIQRSCISLSDLEKVFELNEYTDSEIIIVEEGQFYQGLVKFVKKVVDKDNKHLIISGLNGDCKREAFGEILDLIPLCDDVQKLTAFCKECNDGTLGVFTKRIIESNDKILVGNDNLYMPVCRFHYLC
jgi:thymidine kinase